ncbi:hypothetical protein PGT21_013711 [Puccinia graminis f. sp. tritici]|uniref:Secreted protein n=1 Tax=Puccinia graminis f. sp. tritici TaxID=56615 RepID=A0A5B0RIJ5_PUCGR|nr:hypothetical protein PGT21_013711 [Puccinia graminis f. sp. tritici]KAA1124763.1 hypothetical protein PGTUg99_034016 [Puccinia graminis f. sp. tritici]
MNIRIIVFMLALGFTHTACAALAPAKMTCSHCEGSNVFQTTLPGYPTHGHCYYYVWDLKELCLEERTKEYYKCHSCQQYTLQNQSNPGDKCTHTNKQKIVWNPPPQAHDPLKAELHSSL